MREGGKSRREEEVRCINWELAKPVPMMTESQLILRDGSYEMVYCSSTTGSSGTIREGEE